MEEQDYVELNTLLAKLRVICLKYTVEIDEHLTEENMRIRRKERERIISLIRNIDSIRKQMPLKNEIIIK